MTGSGPPSERVAETPAGTAPVMSGTSSRGPNQGDPNMLKPDITAPGSDIIAAYTNSDLTAAERDAVRNGTLIPGSGTNMISGTSMASPHVAGAAALMKQARPGWSPAAIKSALMTSAQPIVKLASGAADTGMPLNTAIAMDGPIPLTRSMSMRNTSRSSSVANP